MSPALRGAAHPPEYRYLEICSTVSPVFESSPWHGCLYICDELVG